MFNKVTSGIKAFFKGISDFFNRLYNVALFLYGLALGMYFSGITIAACVTIALFPFLAVPIVAFAAAAIALPVVVISAFRNTINFMYDIYDIFKSPLAKAAPVPTTATAPAIPEAKAERIHSSTGQINSKLASEGIAPTIVKVDAKPIKQPQVINAVAANSFSLDDDKSIQVFPTPGV
jgi:hypothetical protein